MKIYIFGTNLFATMMHLYLKEQGMEAEGFLIQREYFDPNRNFELPVYVYEDVKNSLISTNDVKVLVALGYTEMNGFRERIFKLLESDHIPIMSFVHKSAVVSNTSTLGEGCIVLENASIQARTHLGKGNIVWSNVNLCHDTLIEDFNFFAASSAILGNIVIGNRNFFGCNCTIKDGVQIGNRNLIGAASYLSFDCQNEEVIVPEKSKKLSKKSIDLV